MTGQGERRHKGCMNIRDVVRIDRDRLASQFNRLAITFQPEIGPCLVAVPILERRIVRARPNRLVEIFNAFVEIPRGVHSRSPGAPPRPRWAGPGRARACARRRLPRCAPGTEGWVTGANWRARLSWGPRGRGSADTGSGGRECRGGLPDSGRTRF